MKKDKKEIKENKKQIKENKKKNKTKEIKQEEKSKYILEMKAVSYRYSDAKKDEYVLKNINYGFKLGKLYAIKGKSGSGKTTLLSLISGLEKKYEGTILYN